MDEFDRAEARMAKRHERLGVPATVTEAAALEAMRNEAATVTDFVQKPAEERPKTRGAFHRMRLS